MEHPFNYELYLPSNAKSFGSVNAGVLQEVVHWARSDGIVLDPIYSAKLFYEAKKIIQQKNLQGSILLVHSGGQLALCAYHDLLYKYTCQSYLSFISSKS
jgi:1-aminocyclopropane-1-carboxylate deaminase